MPSGKMVLLVATTITTGIHENGNKDVIKRLCFHANCDTG